MNRLKQAFGIGCILAAMFFLFLAFNHRQVFSEDCCGLETWTVAKHGYISDPKIEESSGLVFVKNGLFWTHNDDEDYRLYLIDDTGKRKAAWPVNIQNYDWEEITTDDSGKLYIGNFGNNFNKRTFLTIWKLDPETRKIEGFSHFKYAEQKSFPPLLPWQMNYDCEAMVHWGDSLYLFTKNKTDHDSFVYAISDKPGHYTISKRQKIKLSGMVTGAALRKDGKELALLTYQRIYLFDVRAGFQIAEKPKLCIPIWNGRQMEAITYWGSDSLMVSNEQRDLFLVSKKR